MRINRISNGSYKGAYIPSTPEQPKYLYNYVSDIVRKYKIPATFANKYIELPRTCKEVLEELVKKGISFIER